MNTIDLKQLLADTLAAAKSELGNKWDAVKPYAEHEFAHFADTAVFLANLKLTGQIENDELQARLSIQKMALNNVLLAVEGIGLVMAQNIVNTVQDIVIAFVEKNMNVVITSA